MNITPTAENTTRIGILSRTFGKQGQMLCLLRNDLWEYTEATFLILYIHNLPVPFRLTEWRWKTDDSIIVSLKGIDSEEKAVSMTGTEVGVLQEDISKPNGDSQEMLWTDLIGYTLITADGNTAGVITDIDDSTENVVAQTTDGTLFPLHENLITAIDEEQRTVSLNINKLI